MFYYKSSELTHTHRVESLFIEGAHVSVEENESSKIQFSFACEDLMNRDHGWFGNVSDPIVFVFVKNET